MNTDMSFLFCPQQPPPHEQKMESLSAMDSHQHQHHQHQHHVFMSSLQQPQASLHYDGVPSHLISSDASNGSMMNQAFGHLSSHCGGAGHLPTKVYGDGMMGVGGQEHVYHGIEAEHQNPMVAPCDDDDLLLVGGGDSAETSLLTLQSILKSQYGIHLTLQQLLAFDALPALLHTSSSSSSSSDNVDASLLHEDHPAYYPNMYDQNEVDQHALLHPPYTTNALLATPSSDQDLPGTANTMFLLPEFDQASYGLHHIRHHAPYDALGSPGTSAQSSSVVTDAENSLGYHRGHVSQMNVRSAVPLRLPDDAYHHHPTKYTNAIPIPCSHWNSGSSLPAPGSWQPGDYHQQPGLVETGEHYEPFHSHYHSMEMQQQAVGSHGQSLSDVIQPPPAQRRKIVQGFTMEDVMRAENQMMHLMGRKDENEQASSSSSSKGLITASFDMPMPLLRAPILSAAKPSQAQSPEESPSIMPTIPQVVSPITTSCSFDTMKSKKQASSTVTTKAMAMAMASASAMGTVSSSSVEPQSIAARHRRKRIREKTESLSLLIPGATRLDTAAMFDFAIKYVNFMQAQMICLENEVGSSNSSSSQSMDAPQARHHHASSFRSQTERDPGSACIFRRALIHRLLSSPEIQHHLSREGVCLVSQNLAGRLQP